MNKRISTRQGFTLIEIMLAMGIFVFIFAGVVGVLMGGQRSWSVAEAKIRGNEQLSLALSKMAKELRHSGSIHAEISADRHSIMFQVPLDLDGDGKYDWNATGTDRVWGIDGQGNLWAHYYINAESNKLIRGVGPKENPQVETTLARDINQITFSAHALYLPEYISIEVTAEIEGVETTKRINVLPKNY